MTALVRTELEKLRTTRLVYGMLAGTLALAVLGVVAAVLSAGAVEEIAALETRQGIRNVLGAASAGVFFVLVLGVLGMAGEFRHATATQVFLVTPRRGRVVLAKLVAYALVGLVFGVLASVLTVAIAVPWLAARDVSLSLADADVWVVLGGSLAISALYGALGVSVGALLRNQVAAVLLALAWVLVIENILIALLGAADLDAVGRWLPGAAAAAVTGQQVPGIELLPAWAGGLVLLAYTVVFAAFGLRLVVRGDIT